MEASLRNSTGFTRPIERNSEDCGDVEPGDVLTLSREKCERRRTSEIFLNVPSVYLFIHLFYRNETELNSSMGIGSILLADDFPTLSIRVELSPKPDVRYLRNVYIRDCNLTSVKKVTRISPRCSRPSVRLL